MQTYDIDLNRHVLQVFPLAWGSLVLTELHCSAICFFIYFMLSYVSANALVTHNILLFTFHNLMLQPECVRSNASQMLPFLACLSELTFCSISLVVAQWFSMLWSKSKMILTPLSPSVGPAEKVSNVEAEVRHKRNSKRFYSRHVHLRKYSNYLKFFWMFIFFNYSLSPIYACSSWNHKWQFCIVSYFHKNDCRHNSPAKIPVIFLFLSMQVFVAHVQWTLMEETLLPVSTRSTLTLTSRLRFIHCHTCTWWRIWYQ